MNSQAHDDSQRDPLSSLHEHELFVNQTVDDLVCIAGWLQLKRDGHQVRFAVDFSELYDYAHPFVQFGRFAINLGARIKSSRRKTLIRRQIALAFLFNDPQHKGSLLVLPPHMVELRNHVALLRQKIYKSISTIHSVLDETLDAADLRGDLFDSILLKLTKGESLTDDEERTFIDFVVSYYRELLLLEFYGDDTDYGRGLNELKRLWDEGYLLTVKQAFSPDDVLDKWDPSDASRMAEVLNDLRSERKIQNRRDANALSMARFLSLHVDGPAGYVFLVSSSAKMSSLQSEELTYAVRVGDTVEHIGVVWDPRCFLTYLVNMQGSDGSTLLHVRDLLESFRQYQRIVQTYRGLIATDGVGKSTALATIQELFPDARVTITRIEEISRSLEALRLPLARNRYLSEHIETVKVAADMTKHEQRVIKLANAIRGADSGTREVLEREFILRVSHLADDRSGLLRVVDSLIDEETRSKLSAAMMSLYSDLWDTLAMKLTEAGETTSIRIGGQDLRTITDPLVRAVETDGADVEDVLVELFRSRLSENRPAQNNLLFGCLLFAADDYAGSLQEVLLGLEKFHLGADTGDDAEHELRLLRSIICRVTCSNPVQLEAGCHAARQAVHISDRKDPRSLRELGRILYRRWAMQDMIAAEADEATGMQDDDLAEALAVTREAYSALSGYEWEDAEELRLQLANNMLFFNLLMVEEEHIGGDATLDEAQTYGRILERQIRELEEDKKATPVNELNLLWLRLATHSAGEITIGDASQIRREFDEAIGQLRSENSIRFYSRLRARIDALPTGK